eukprot:6485685-Amphidinium_carterae.1
MTYNKPAHVSNSHYVYRKRSAGAIVTQAARLPSFTASNWGKSSAKSTTAMDHCNPHFLVVTRRNGCISRGAR